ncbi:hypothetical protein [Kocuria nitroreducens]|uniref:hypothetical protein n=1 Tax=Kocuria nitroreducens TaxID=3058914 RepID=UPI0036D936D4
MRGKIRQVTVVALSVGALLVGGVAPAAAARDDNTQKPGAQTDGAQTIRESDCSGDEYTTSCNSYRQVSNSVETPSGNRIEQGKSSRGQSRTSGGELSFSYEDNSRYQTLSKDGVGHEGGYRSSNTLTYSDGSSCTSSSSSHYTGEREQFNDTNYECN